MKTKSKLHRIFSVPPYSYCDFLDKDDLITLRKTNTYFVHCLFAIASPKINLHISPLSSHNYDKAIAYFPKAKISIDFHLGIYYLPSYLRKMVSATALNCPYYAYLGLKHLSHLTRLTSLSMDHCTLIHPEKTTNTEIDHLTQLKNLSIDSNKFLLGATLRKFTNLEQLSLSGNTVIQTNDLEYLKLSLRSLSISDNDTINPRILPKLQLTKLNIMYNKAVTFDIIFQCKTIRDLSISDDKLILGKSLSTLTFLQKLTIKSAYIREDYEVNYDMLNSLTSLTELHFVENDIATPLIKDSKLSLLINLTNLTICSDVFMGSCFVNLKNLIRLKIAGKKFDAVNLKYLTELKYLYLGRRTRLLEINMWKLTSLISLEIHCSFKCILTGINRNLQSLAIYSSLGPTELINSALIKKLIGLRRLYLNGNNKVTIQCLLGLTSLVFVSMPERKNLNKEHLRELINKGVRFVSSEE
ncbi:MAG: hypothetical protein Harvfovirus17_5 [Harvfovirus sp.]|uniref:Leucine-rich repeat protein n=1 Tax=Harvfovirus sp. TaxID=2487768 RepID=A0A3G5A4H5_9VIRU|nr:MAG: hypothetical protein Harvfovirus17_5 [Harvfovirus sp.]